MYIGACVFDLGNTLVDDVQLQKYALRKLVKWMTAAQYLDEERQADFEKVYLKNLRSNSTPFLSHTYGELVFFEETFAELGIHSCKPAVVLEAYRKFIMEGVEPNRDVIAALRFLRSSGIRTGLVSNESTERVDAFMEKTGMANLFDTILVSKSLGIEKPDLRIFKKALTELNIPADQVVMFGDNEISDGACKVLGMIFVLVSGYRNPQWVWEKGPAFLPDLSIDTVTEEVLRKLIPRIEKRVEEGKC